MSLVRFRSSIVTVKQSFIVVVKWSVVHVIMTLRVFIANNITA